MHVRVPFRLASATVLAIAMPLCLTGCSSEFGGPPPGEARRKSIVESGKAGAASIEELREAYRKAHRKKDFKALGELCLWNLGRRSWLPQGQLNPTEAAMRKIMEFPIKSVGFEAGPLVGPEGDATVSYIRPNGKPAYHIGGKIAGKLILVMADGEFLDASYVVLNYYGRYFLQVGQFVVEDAAQHLKTGRPREYVAVPMNRPRRRKNPDGPADAILGR
jgi:hypothetical protein